MKKYILPIVCLLLLVSCADQLDQYSFAAISPDAVTEKDIPAMRNGMYNRIQNAPSTRAYIMFDMLGGVISTNTGNAKDLINSTLSPLNSYISSSWNGYYNALFQVNNVISVSERFPESEVGQTTLGEAHYFRAYIYYNLVSRWGGVPIIKVNTLDKVARDSESDVWEFIEEELESAIDILGSTSTFYLVSRDAALALKARVLLSQGKMQEAAAVAEGLINSGAYKLDSFEKIFRKQMNSEVIFAFENLTEESSINISDLYYTYGHPNKGQGTYKPTPETVALFSDSDNRKSISLINIAGSDCINKYPSGQTGTDPIIVSRIAEIYLISAEAQGRTAGVGRLNELRRFRGLGDIYPTNDEDYLTAILDERKRELLGENFIYYDIVRTGRGKTDLDLLDHQMVLPIPGRELQLNPNLEPNPGY